LQDIDSRERALDEKMKATTKEAVKSKKAAIKTVHAERAWSSDKAKEWQGTLAWKRTVHEKVLAARDIKVTELEATIKGKEKEIKEINSQHKLELRELKKQHADVVTLLTSQGGKNDLGVFFLDNTKVQTSRLNRA